MASKKQSYSASLNSNGPVKDIAKTYIFRNLSKNIVTLSKKFIFFEFKKYPTINGNKINKESCARVSKKLNENSSAFIEMILNQNTVVNGVINEVNVVNETESGIFPPLQWVKIPEMNPPGANKTIAIDIANILELNTK